MLFQEGVRLLDCSYVPDVKPNWNKFKNELYGKFETLAQFKSSGREMYNSGHISGAVHADLDCAMYPGRYERFSHYPPEIFEKYVQLLGIDSQEDLIFYGRGAFGGMMFAARMAWLFRSYGHEKVTLLDGGVDNWTKNGFDLTQEVPKLERGNWTASDNFASTLITFEQLEAVNGVYEDPVKIDESDPDRERKEKQAKWNETPKEPMFMDKTGETNFLDARPRSQYSGQQETGLNQMYVIGSHIPGFKNAPVGEIISKEGTMKTIEDIRTWLSEIGYIPDQKLVIHCNTGMQASLLAFSMLHALPEASTVVYNGSLKEMEVRDPKKISAGNRDIPIKNN